MAGLLVRVGVDVGGTFTDVVAVDESGRIVWGKVLTRPREPWVSAAEAASGTGLQGRAGALVNATTLGANLVFGQAGLERPRVVLVTNRGFEDVLEIGRQNRPSLYDPLFVKPEPLVPRRLRYGVGGRLAADGSVVEDLDLGDVRRVVREQCRPGTVFAVVFLHSYANPSHEARAAEAIEDECPGAVVVTSSSIDPRPGEYERASTTVVNALLKTVLSEYFSRLSGSLAASGFRGRVYVMKSDGGIATVGEAARAPAAFIESGPAAGVVAAAWLSRLLGLDVVLSFDMGGTTAKASSIVGGEPLVTDIYEVGGRVHYGRLVRGSGYPVRHTFIDLAEVSAGGGTVAWVDRGGALRVGPRSAGSEPGPACYGRGGSEPTVTDANAVLGRLPGRLAGGLVEVRADLAVRVMEKLAAQAGLGSAHEAAEAVVDLANTLMARAVRLVSVERGVDPSTASMVAFGGAGPLHAVEIARTMGVGEVIVPPYPGVFSALGLVVADFKVVRTRHVGRPLDEVDGDRLDHVYSELEAEARRPLEGVDGLSGVIVSRVAVVRYRGQTGSARIPYTGLPGLRGRFEEEYRRRYGVTPPGGVVELAEVEVEVVGLTEKPMPNPPVGGRPEEAEVTVYVDGEMVETLAVNYWWLAGQGSIEGPALVYLDSSTLYLPPGSRARLGGLGEVRVAP